MTTSREAASTKQSRTGRPSHVVWSHFIRGEKRNKCHHHVYCRYCSQAHAQSVAGNGATVGPASVECIRGVPDAMLRHLTTCAYAPPSVQLQMKLAVAQLRSKKPSSSTTTPSTTLDDLLQLDDSIDKVATSTSDGGNSNEQPDRPTLRGAPLTVDTLVKIACSGSVPSSWLYNEHVQALLPRSGGIPSPDSVYALACTSSLAKYKMTRGFWTLSVTSWDSVCTRQHVVACSVVRQAPPAVHSTIPPTQMHLHHTFSIQGVEPASDALTRHLTEVLRILCCQANDAATSRQQAPATICQEEGAVVVGVVCDSAKILAAARAAIGALNLPLVSTLCVQSILRLVAGRVFLTHKDVVRDVLFATPAAAGAFPTTQSWASWVNCILAANVIHPLSDACSVLRTAFAATTGVHPFALHDAVEVMMAMRQHDQFHDILDNVWSAVMDPSSLTAWATVLSFGLHNVPRACNHPTLAWTEAFEAPTSNAPDPHVPGPSNPPTLSTPDALQWVSLASYAQNLARRWHLDDGALARDLLVHINHRTSPEVATANEPQPSDAMAAPSPAKSTLDEFIARLEGYTPMAVSLAPHIPGLGGLTLTGRTDVPHGVLLPMVHHQQLQEVGGYCQPVVDFCVF